jgi:protein tyrosine phosphatase (PTP) superfamily phosphohydrolase (DUF442 family)
MQQAAIKWAWRGTALALVCAGVLVAYEATRVYGGLNLHVVIPNKVYRCAQPSAKELADTMQRHGIKTVLNLRGQPTWEPWFQDELLIAQERGVSQENVTLSAHTLPFPSELIEALAVLDRAEYPILIHCKQGADRTGLLSTLVLLLYTDATLAEARVQLLPRYGHWPITRTQNIDCFFDLYEEHLSQAGYGHSPERLREWITSVYPNLVPRSELSFAEALPQPWQRDKPVGVTVRCKNVSAVPWKLSAGVFAGVHVAYVVYDEAGKDIWNGRCGFKNATIGPGEDFTTVVPVRALPHGRYWLNIELHDATGAGVPFRTQSFVKYGNASLLTEIRIP